MLASWGFTGLMSPHPFPASENKHCERTLFSYQVVGTFSESNSWEETRFDPRSVHSETQHLPVVYKNSFHAHLVSEATIWSLRIVAH